MKKNKNHGVALSALVFTLLVADESARAEGLEIGTSVGTPAGVNFHLGYWGPEVSPFVIRFSGMYFPPVEDAYWDRKIGLQLDNGWVVDAEGPFKQFVAVSTSYYDFGDSSTRSAGVGPTYNFHWHGLLGQFGLGYAIAGDTRSPAHLFAQIGYSALL
jgi:hypothetical protein